jgi:hypothetical protein
MEGIYWGLSRSLHSTGFDENKAWRISSREPRHQNYDVVLTCLQQSEPLCLRHGEYWRQEDHEFQEGSESQEDETRGYQHENWVQWLLSDYLKHEKNNNVYAASKTRKMAFELGLFQPRAQMANHSAYRLPALGAKFQPPQRKNHNVQQPQRNQKPFKMAIPQAKVGQGSLSRAVTTVRGPCFNYNQSGHFAKFCPFSRSSKINTKLVCTTPPLMTS